MNAMTEQTYRPIILSKYTGVKILPEPDFERRHPVDP